MKFIRNLLTGKSKTGRALQAVLDVAPIPNIHEVAKKAIKERPELSGWELTKLTVSKLDPIRTVLGIVIAVGLIQGWFTAEQIKEAVASIKELF